MTTPPPDPAPSSQQAASGSAADAATSRRLLVVLVLSTSLVGFGYALYLLGRPSQAELAARVMQGDHAAGTELLNRTRSAWVGSAEAQAKPHGTLYGFGGAVLVRDTERMDPKPGTATGWPYAAGLGGRPVILRPYRIVGERSLGAFMAYVFTPEGELATAKLHVLSRRVPWELAEFGLEDGVLTTYAPHGPRFRLEGDELVEVSPTPGR